MPIFKPLLSSNKTAKKAAKPSIDEQILDAGVRLRALESNYKTIIKRELGAIRKSKSMNRDNPKATAKVKNAFYALSVVNHARESLREITSAQELAKSMNELNSVLHLLGTISGNTEKAKRVKPETLDRIDDNTDRGIQKIFKGGIDNLVDDSVLDQLLKGEEIDDCLEQQEVKYDSADDVIEFDAESVLNEAVNNNTDEELRKFNDWLNQEVN